MTERRPPEGPYNSSSPLRRWAQESWTVTEAPETDDRVAAVHSRVVADLEGVAARATAAARDLERAGAAPNEVLAVRQAGEAAARAATELRGALMDGAQQRLL